MATVFATDIRPYFTACFRAHMIEFGLFDLWLKDDVQQRFDLIRERVAGGTMPPAPGGAIPPCPEGGWDDLTRAQFLADFDAWRTGNFQ